jgi:hypothetical protein
MKRGESLVLHIYPFRWVERERVREMDGTCKRER